jgi:excinuclease UvrABC nuclease subunit
LINEINTLESILGRLADLKYGNRVRSIEIAEADHDFRRAIRLRKQINKLQELESEIGAQIPSHNLRNVITFYF